MGNLASVVLALVSSSRSLPPAADRPPPPRPRPAPSPPQREIEIICILDDPPPVRMCADTFPRIRWLSRMKPCPDWVDKIIAEVERI